MRTIFLCAALAAMLCACSRQDDKVTSDQGTSGNGAVYGRGGGKDDHQRANENATDTRPRGGSMQGAGGAGPGYDGSRQGTNERDFAPAPGAGFAGGLTNSNPITNSPAPTAKEGTSEPPALPSNAQPPPNGAPVPKPNPDSGQRR